MYHTSLKGTFSKINAQFLIISIKSYKLFHYSETSKTNNICLKLFSFFQRKLCFKIVNSKQGINFVQLSVCEGEN